MLINSMWCFILWPWLNLHVLIIYIYISCADTMPLYGHPYIDLYTSWLSYQCWLHILQLLSLVQQGVQLPSGGLFNSAYWAFAWLSQIKIFQSLNLLCPLYQLRCKVGIATRFDITPRDTSSTCTGRLLHLL